MSQQRPLTALLLASLLAACSSSPEAGTAQTPIAFATSSPAAVPPKSSDESLTIAFDEGGARLSPQADDQLDTAARLYRDAKPEVMIVSGHSDKTGGEYQNLILSARRADLVKKALVDRGVPAERLQIVAIGEAEPVVGVVPSRSAIVTWR